MGTSSHTPATLIWANRWANPTHMPTCTTDSKGRVSLGKRAAPGDVWQVIERAPDRIELVRLAPKARVPRRSLIEYGRLLHEQGFVMPPPDESPVSNEPLG